MDFTSEERLQLKQFIGSVSDTGFSPVSAYEDLWRLTTPETRQLIEKIMGFDPREFGFRGSAILVESTPHDIISIPLPPKASEGDSLANQYAYMPKMVYEAFNNMSSAFNNEFSPRKLLVLSGYRSPAFQIVTLIYYLCRIYDFDLSQTLKRVAMPAYSQHCSSSRTAIDIGNIDDQPDDEEPEKFKDSVEYLWLQQNASKYHFYESYPLNNPDGIMGEPWHWQFRPSE